MDRPHATRDRLAADAARHSAAEHAQRAAHLARRAAAARRRALLTLVLLVGVAAGWSVVGLVGATILLGIVPTVTLGAVLALGRRAVVAGARADARWEAGAATRAPLPASSRTAGVTGRAVRPSDATTEVMARVPSTTKVPEAPAAAVEAAHEAGPAAGQRVTTRRITAEAAARADAGTWEPVPVPRPAYTLKPSARRAEPAPLVLDEQVVPAAQQTAGETHEETLAATEDARADRRPGDVPAGVDTPVEQAATARATTSSAATSAGLDLDAILARRRASGE